MSRTPQFRLYDFKVTNEKGFGERGAPTLLTIQMFGLNEKGETASILVKNFEPFFYVKVGDDWNHSTVKRFKEKIREHLARADLEDKYKKWVKGDNVYPTPKDDEGKVDYINNNLKSFIPYHFKGIADFRMVKRHKLYGFDNKKMYNFVAILFKNTSAMNKIKNIWYDRIPNANSHFGYDQKLKTVEFFSYDTELYEAKLPPLLRYFHIRNISPSGWVEFERGKFTVVKRKKTNCDFEFSVDWKYIVPLPEKETAVPLKICSFDIEASSSHGDFPVAIKTYKKLAGDIVTHWNKHSDDIKELTRVDQKIALKRLIRAAFGFEKEEDINIVYPKQKVREAYIDERINDLFAQTLRTLIQSGSFKRTDSNDELDRDDEVYIPKKTWMPYVRGKNSKGGSYKIIDCLNDNTDAAKKVEILDNAFTKMFPPLEGDKVTFIGSTFLIAGETDPYLNHGICLNDCSGFDMRNSDVEIVSCDDEADLLTEWTEVMNREKPHIVIGYNIFGFDYKFMCDRASENECFDEFCEIGFNKGVKSKREEKSIKIASGTHDLVYLKMDGIIQVDLYNYFRREVNLGSYKLQDVASHFIGDMVSEVEYNGEYTVIKSRNLMGLQEENFVIFQVIGHSVDDYEKGRKFQVTYLDEKNGEFWVKEEVIMPAKGKLRWGLGKDDVSPQDLFRLTNGTPDDRAIIAKYCFQDCNLVHHLLRKNDVLTGMSEIASICSVPIDFIVMRGQGIKLLSFIAKKCRENNTLMPVIEKAVNDGSYEGAIVLPPKTGFYTDIPVAVVDYASLYPSSMISENISHDSKVWTKEYDLEGVLQNETGETDEDGNYVYDNLPEYQYVDVEYDMYEYIRKDGKKKEEKVLVGKKVCRFAQFPDGGKALMPAILTELLKARKDTRKLIKYKTVKLKSGDEHSGLLSEKENHYVVENKQGVKIIEKNSVECVMDTYNDFMKNVFNQRQLGYKVTANSLYGQCGARTSAFYDKDIAASTTATGRKLLTYGKRIIEDVYGDRVCETKHGTVKSNAEYIYGDSVTGDEPLILKGPDGKVTIKTIESLCNEWEQYENFKPLDTVISNRREKQKGYTKYKVWAKDKWNPIKKVIRHKTDKKIYRVNTHRGVVDVTEDHSLIGENYQKIKPEECSIGVTKLSHTFPKDFVEFDCYVEEHGTKNNTNYENSCESKNKLYECSTCKKELGEKSYYYYKNKRTKQCKLCKKKTTCIRLGKKFDNELKYEKVEIYREKYKITTDEAKVWGMFVGDGSCGKYYCSSSGIKYSWAINNNNLERLNIYKNILEKVEPIKFKILDTLKSSGVYKLVPCGNIRYITKKYRELFYHETKAKIVPDCILNASYEIRKSFFEGYYDADGSKYGNYGSNKTIQFCTKNKITAQCLYYIATSIGYDKLSVRINENREGNYYWITSCNNWRKHPDTLKKMVYLKNSNNEFVYDLETEHGIYACGVGMLQVFNTDSVFFAFNLTDLDGKKIIGKKALEITIELAIEAGELATKLKPPHDLEYEKRFIHSYFYPKRDM